MGIFPKPCLDCGELTTGSNRCVEHQNLVDNLHNAKRAAVKKQTGQYAGDYRKRAKLVRETALVCHLCNGGARFNDPWVADHANPSEAGSDAILLPAHKSCNEKRGNKPLN
jgi:NifB/MoaA-like Fe-S oxidoreductase